MTKRNRLIAILLIVTVIFVVLFSAFFIVDNANHDCRGDDCPICYVISICNNVLKAVGLTLAALNLSTFLGTVTLFVSSLIERVANHISLVTLRVKLSN